MKVVEMTSKTVEKSKKIKIENANEKKSVMKKNNFWVLFDQLPYLGHQENPAIKDAIKDNIVHNLGLQKYLLVTGL